MTWLGGLSRGLADTEFGCDLFVQQAKDDQCRGRGAVVGTELRCERGHNVELADLDVGATT
jgi:hypothetical protein